MPGLVRDRSKDRINTLLRYGTRYAIAHGAAGVPTSTSYSASGQDMSSVPAGQVALIDEIRVAGAPAAGDGATSVCGFWIKNTRADSVVDEIRFPMLHVNGISTRHSYVLKPNGKMMLPAGAVINWKNEDATTNAYADIRYRLVPEAELSQDYANGGYHMGMQTVQYAPCDGTFPATGNFQLGELVMVGENPSTATWLGTLIGIDMTRKRLYVSGASGTLADDDEITGVTSSATATASGAHASETIHQSGWRSIVVPSSSPTSPIQLVPGMLGKSIEISAIYVLGLTNDAGPENVDVYFTNHENGSPTANTAFKIHYTGANPEQQKQLIINDCVIRGASGYSLYYDVDDTGSAQTVSVTVCYRYINAADAETVSLTGSNSGATQLKKYWWFHNESTGAGGTTIVPNLGTNTVVVRGYAMSGVASTSGTGVGGAYIASGSTVAVSPTYVGWTTDTLSFLRAADDVAFPILNNAPATLQNVAGMSSFAATVWGTIEHSAEAGSGASLG